jgi:GT2 family glycosyltransferase
MYIVIPVFNRWMFTKACLESLNNQTYSKFKIIVVDHGSTDGTSQCILMEYKEVILLKGDESMWWTAATNRGVEYAIIQEDSTYILTLNNDLIVDADYLQNMINLAVSNPKSLIGSISLSIKDSNNITFSGMKWNKWTAKYTRISTHKLLLSGITESDLLPGRGTLIPKQAFTYVGLYDDKLFPHYIADEDFSWQCKQAGYKLLVSHKIFVRSETEATGLNTVHKSKSLKYWQDLFFSIRSPVNLRNKWNWAWKNTPLPPIYFTIDMARIIISKVFKS